MPIASSRSDPLLFVKTRRGTNNDNFRSGKLPPIPGVYSRLIAWSALDVRAVRITVRPRGRENDVNTGEFRVDTDQGLRVKGTGERVESRFIEKNTCARNALPSVVKRSVGESRGGTGQCGPRIKRYERAKTGNRRPSKKTEIDMII